MTRLRKRRKSFGGALVETVAGLFVIIPVVLFLVDVVAMVLAQMAHDAFVKDCARAAAEATDQAAADAAVNLTASHFNNPMLVYNAQSTNFDAGTGRVRVQTTSTFTFPVPIPFWNDSQQTFVAEAVEPIVGIPAP